jgi:hypothetical protein
MGEVILDTFCNNALVNNRRTTWGQVFNLPVFSGCSGRNRRTRLGYDRGLDKRRLPTGLLLEKAVC